MPQNAYPEKVDLSSCEKEPIHIIGAIQSHGVLVACDKVNARISQISENCEDVFGETPDSLLGQDLQRLIGRDLAHNILEATGPEGHFQVQELMLNGRPFTVIPHLSGDSVILDIEPVDAREDKLDFQKELSSILNTLSASGSTEELCRNAVKITRKTFGYDRVMIYKFDREWNGKVIAEEKNTEMESWLGLHYPASDIPKQARELFLKNKIRIIADVNYSPVKITPEISPVNDRPLDLTNSKLRAVSPIHIEYLQNMEVGASLTAALISNGKLWGLLACHHNTAKFINYYQRQTCEFLIQIFSNELSVKNSGKYLRNIEKYDGLRSRLIGQIKQTGSIKKGLCDLPLKVTDLFPCGGAAIILNGKIKLVGNTPQKKQVREFWKTILSNHDDNVFLSKNLFHRYPHAKNFKESASGILAVRLGRSEQDFIIWFRPEVLQTVNWGGDPKNKASFDTEKDRLTPRKSFKIWSEQVTGVSDAWEDHEVTGARNLSESVSYVILEKQKTKIDNLNNQLLSAHKELELFSHGLSHDLKAPLRGINGYAYILKEDHYFNLPKAGQKAVDTILSSTNEMGQLIDNMLSFAGVSEKSLHKNIFSVNHLLDDVLQSLNLQVNYPDTKILIEDDLPAMLADKRMLTQVWSNLMTNALKYSEHVQNPEIQVGTNVNANKTVYYVRDNGVGFHPKYKEKIFDLFSRFSDESYKGTGIGLAIAKKIIEKHQGEIWAESEPGKGSTFYFYV